MGTITYWWMVDFPENAHLSFHFLSKEETALAVSRIQKDRGDVEPTPFSWTEILRHFLDPKIYGFAAMFFLLVSPTDAIMGELQLTWPRQNLVSTALSYFLPIM